MMVHARRAWMDMVPVRASDEERLGFMEEQLALTEDAERQWLELPDDEEVPPALYALIRARRELVRRVTAVHRSRLRRMTSEPREALLPPPPRGGPACEWAVIVLFVASIAWGLVMLSRADDADAAAAAAAALRGHSPPSFPLP